MTASLRIYMMLSMPPSADFTPSGDSRRDSSRDILALTATAFLWRLLFHIAYTPWWSGDSPGYARTWWVVSTRAWQYYDGLRPPAYPVFLGITQLLTGASASEHLSNLAAELAVSLQQLAGVGATILMYFLLRNLGVSRRARFLAAIFYALLVPVSLFEMMILPIALASSLLILALWLLSVAVGQKKEGKSPMVFAAGSGLAFAAGAFFRAELLVFFGVLVGSAFASTWIFRRQPELKALRRVLFTVLISAAPLLFLWTSFNYLMLGQFVFTTSKSYNATSTVYNLFGNVPPEDRIFGEIMLRYYRGPARIDLINDAWPELLAHEAEMPIHRRGPLSKVADLCAYAGEVAGRLQRRYPATYLANATQSFFRTFNFQQGNGIPLEHVKDPESPDRKAILRNMFAYKATEDVRRMQPPFMMVFYGLAILLFPVSRFARQRPTVGLILLMAIDAGMLATLLAYGFLHTYFIHYGVVFFGCIVVCGTTIFDRLIKAGRLKFGSSLLGPQA